MSATVNGWTVNVYPVGTGFKVVAFKGCRVLHVEKLTAVDVAVFDPDARWAGNGVTRPPPGPFVDFAAMTGNLAVTLEGST